MKYRPCTAAEIAVAQTIRYWSTPGYAQGQTVEVSYSEGPQMRRPAECDRGDRWRRTVDRSEGPDAPPVYAVRVD